MYTKAAVASLALGVVSVLAAPPPPHRSTAAPAQYQYQYAVSDQYAALEFGQTESRDGDTTSGSYHVLLPDGRVQRVRYSVLGEEGYQAEVTYEGEASEAQYQRPRPVYYTAPVYRAVPSYGARHHSGGRARTYILRTTTEVPLAIAEETPAEQGASAEESIAEDVYEEADEDVVEEDVNAKAEVVSYVEEEQELEEEEDVQEDAVTADVVEVQEEVAEREDEPEAYEENSSSAA